MSFEKQNDARALLATMPATALSGVAGSFFYPKNTSVDVHGRRCILTKNFPKLVQQGDLKQLSI